MKGEIFTPVSLVKKTFKHGERSLSREEIAQRLHAFTEDENFNLEACIQAALNHPFSPFREGNSRAIIEYVYESQPLANHVYRLLTEAGLPLSEDKILRKLRGLNLISWNYSFDRLGLYGDSRFSQLQTDLRWCCADWEIVNDDIYSYLTKQGIKEMFLNDIAFLIQSKLHVSKNHRLFVPQVDQRFVIEGDKLYLLDASNEQQSVDNSSTNFMKEMNDRINESYSEVAVAMNQETLDREQNLSNTVVDEVVSDLMGALIKLEKRSNDMQQEVLQHFASGNLGAIEFLMKEKEKNEKVLAKLQEIVEELS
ncbi:MAG TPA: hypothetical protein VJ824_02280 [Bacillota bacterium]|nr:hypothetical protein [Bacillota bacterium]